MLIQNYYRGANGALVFVDLKCFKTRDERESVILHTEKLMRDLEQCVGIKLPCLLVGAKVRDCCINFHLKFFLKFS